MFLAACGDEPAGPPHRPLKAIGEVTSDFAAIAASEMAEALAGRQLRDVEDDILRMEAKLPGFGGLFVDSTGTVTVYGPQEMSAEATRAKMAEHAAEFHLLGEHQQQLTAGDRVRVLSAAYSFSQLLAWKQGLSSMRAPGDGIVIYDADEGRNRISVGVLDEAAVDRLFARAAAIGVPEAAIVTEITGVAKATGAPADSFLMSTVRELRAGVEIAVDMGCTMGFIVKGPGALPIKFLTASHCESSPGSIGGTVRQNGVGRVVGSVSENTSFNVWHPSCGSWSGSRCTWADVMVVQMAQAEWPIAISTGYTRYTTSGASLVITGSTAITSQTTPYIGMNITRIGKNTGTTGGTVDTMGTTGATCEDGLVEIVATGQEFINLCVTRVKNNQGQQGDSGGPVVVGSTAVGISVADDCTISCKTWFNSLAVARSVLHFATPY